ncbi:MAG: RnfABCDGE type electron transport complex subunit D [Solobacterium sp.]|nr:RnfABCDGE type electron transport complex subunit D [Solobacterium sp.]
MKFTFNPSPNYRNEQSTTSIMIDVLLCLLAVDLYAVIYYWAAYGAQYGLRVILLTLAACVSALATDAVYYKILKKDVIKEVRSSFSLITALIIVLISRINTAYYAIVIATIIAIFFGKLVFGGFGQNIFNPAAFGAAIIMGNFAGSYNMDFATGATPTQCAKAFGWMIPTDQFEFFMSGVGTLGKMFLGQYTSTIGSTCALLILLCGAYLIWRKDIDWQTPVFYIGTVFVEALVIGLMHGAGLEYALFSVLAGGVIFGGVFMTTDPVTTPVSLPGRVLWAIGCASLTLIIRDKSNLSDGVLFAILLMNMLTPAIDKLFDGNQIKDAAKFQRNVLIGGICCVALTLLVGTSVKSEAELKAAEGNESSAAAPAAEAGASAGDASFGEALPMSYNFNANKASCQLDGQEGDKIRYSCEAKGFGLVTNADGDYSMNKAMVVVDAATGKVSSISIIEFGDTAGVGDKATADNALAQFEGKGLDDEVNLVTGATFTTRSIAAMAQAALKASGDAEPSTAAAPAAEAAAPAGDVSLGEALPMSYNFNANKAVCELDGKEGDTIRYSCEAKGFGLVTNADGDYSMNKAMVVVDGGKVSSISLIEFGDTAGVGDAATTDAALAQFAGKGLDDEVNLVTGATFTTRSIAAMAQAALKAAAEGGN